VAAQSFSAFREATSLERREKEEEGELERRFAMAESLCPKCALTPFFVLQLLGWVQQ
jgi:hypothetical protein